MAGGRAGGLGGFLDELEWRGILHAATPGLAARLATGQPISAYIGFDPSFESLHVGHLVPVFGLSKSPAEKPLETHVYSLGSHLVYGLTTEVVRRMIRDSA